MGSFAKIKPSRNSENSLTFTDVRKSCQSQILTMANMSFNAIRKNKFHSKVSKFTVKFTKYLDLFFSLLMFSLLLSCSFLEATVGGLTGFTICLDLGIVMRR